MTPLYACSTNAGKLREFALAAWQIAPDIRIEPLPDLATIRPPEETGTTFEENASLKARYYSRFKSELVFADDSGLEVVALNGAPGVHSARFAGPDASDERNNALLLEKLADETDRRARFVCVIALAGNGEIIDIFRGTVDGEILKAPLGNNGFGYDPLFWYAPLSRSFAELSPAEKFAVSHRGAALRAMLSSAGLNC